MEAPSDVPSAWVLRDALTEADGEGRATGGARAVIVTEEVD
jgi:hypothetical protein